MQALYNNYLAVLLATLTGTMMVTTAVLGTRLLAPFAGSREKSTSYECGMLPIGRVRTQIHVRYYVFAILFLIFDVEAVFMFPWAVTFLQSKTELFSMLVFIAVLGAGLGYAWKKGALEWK
jgi:NADH:ubiquinone oxidoreductase subunit 3 (subunit A)